MPTSIRKKIILFSDGTGNSASNPHKTNVWRTYKALDLSTDANQHPFYDDGVGTSTFLPLKILGLAFGWGLARNVKQLYRQLCLSYETDNTDIYTFGFSRGAYTIRVLTGLIASEGIVDTSKYTGKALDRKIHKTYRAFRFRNFNPSLLSLPLWCLQKLFGFGIADNSDNLRSDPSRDKVDDPLIRFIGVWDTVSAYGGPIHELTLAWDKIVWPFIAKDLKLSKRVGRACHALALDEQRKSFTPLLWEEDDDSRESNPSGGRISQVWFPGVHACVGGGYPDDSLALGPLNWMLDECSGDGGLQLLTTERNRYCNEANVNGHMYDSRGGMGIIYRYSPRNVSELCKGYRPGFINNSLQVLSRFKVLRKLNVLSELSAPTGHLPKMHQSVFQRIRGSTETYAPISVPGQYALATADGQIIRQGDAAGTFPETKLQITNRAGTKTTVGRQSATWNKVWFNKFLHNTTLAVIALFVLLPYIDRGGALSGSIESFVSVYLTRILGGLGDVLHSAPDALGSLLGVSAVESWLDRYKTFPSLFFLSLLLIGLMFIGGLKTRKAINNDMYANWSHLRGDAPPDAASLGWLRTRLAKIRESGGYRRLVKTPTEVMLISIASVIVLLLALSMISRVTYITLDGTGLVCSDNNGKPLEDSASFVFDPKNYCQNTGLALEGGQRYELTMSLASENDNTNAIPGWKDKEIQSNLAGWIDPPAFMSLFTPYRRHLFTPWYQPVIRSDNILFDRHELFGVDSCVMDESKNHVIRQFTARDSGNLYLYMNDAVVFHPALFGNFYRNNHGQAKVIIRKMDDHKAVEACPPDSTTEIN